MNSVSRFAAALGQQISKIAYVDPQDDDTSAYGDPATDHPASEDRKTEAPKEALPADQKNATFNETAKYFGSAVMNFASKATNTVATTAKDMRRVLEEKTIIGEFEKEQGRFIEEQQRETHVISAVPPWVGLDDEAVLKKQMLSLSLDSRNFLRDPPAGIDFDFDFNAAFPIALATLEEDANLRKMRFELVPKTVNEERFWRNYFYRVSLIIKQSSSSSQLQQAWISSSARAKPTANTVGHSGPSTSTTKTYVEHVEQPSSTAAHEFLSDEAEAAGTLSEEELKQLRAQLGVGALGADALKMATNDARSADHDESGVTSGDDWERELVAELNEYELVGGGGAGEHGTTVASGASGKTDEEWEQEISELLAATEEESVPDNEPASHGRKQ